MWKCSLMILLLCATLLPQDSVMLNSDMGIAQFEPLEYPRIAQAARVQGAVVIRVDLDSDGRVTSARALSGPKLLIEDSVANAKKWRFDKNKLRAAVIVYLFKFEGICNRPCSSISTFSPPNVVTVISGEPVLVQ